MAKRRVTWLGSVVTFSTVTAQDFRTIVDEASFEALTQPTIVRIRGTFTMKLNASTGVVYEASSYRMGLMVHHKSIGTGIDVDKLDNPWLWYDSGIVWQPISRRTSFLSTFLWDLTST